jgi:gliding motility-associated-like protein
VWVLDAGFHGGTYRWQPGNDSSRTKAITLFGTYRVEVTDSLGCAGSDTITIAEGVLQVTLGRDTTICPQQPLVLVGNPPGKQYSWSTGSQSDTIRYVGPGTVSLIASDGFCKGSATRRVQHVPQPAFGIEADSTGACASAPVTVRSLHGPVVWHTGVRDTSIQVQPPVWVRASLPDSCYTLQDSLYLEGAAEVVFPNVITPNGDGQNDVLRFAEEATEEYRLEVYNRWGRQVWQSSDATAGWSATDVPDGSYYYSLRYVDCSGIRRLYSGWVQVLR